MSKISDDRRLAADFLRQLANAVERNDASVLATIGPALHALIYEDRGVLQRPTPTPPKPKSPDSPVIYYDADGARPINMVRRRVEYHDTTTGQRVSWPHSWMQLAKFARLPEVKREFWSGSTRIYGDALKHFAHAGFIERRGNGWQWSHGFTPLQRREYAAHWRPTDTLPRASAPHSPKGKS